MIFDITHPDVRRAVEIALAEDVRTGDITTEATVPAALQAEGRFIAREDMTVAGVELLGLLYHDPALRVPSGTRLKPGDEIAVVRGPARLLLTNERVALNFLQRLSGVATLASKFVTAVQGTGVRILDTRKTTPGLRVLEKMASAAGGVVNHRMGLWDAVLIKNNHIRLAGGVRAAVERTKVLGKPIEVEVRTRAEIAEALDCGAGRLLLDNMTPAQAALEIAFIAHRAEVEISGGVTLSNVRAYAEAGPDFISSGSITHSATAVDINCGIMRLDGFTDRRVEWFDSIDSTMTAAARLAREGCASGTVVGADEQTAGIGRHGHSWHSEPGAGLYISVVLRLPIASDALPLVMLALGLATQQAISEVTGLAPDLRWPNDVLLNGKKCAGILAQFEGDAVIAGIGINVSHTRFPDDLVALATSLLLAGGIVSRERLLNALLRSIDDTCRILMTDGPAAIRAAFTRASSYASGRRVRVEQDAGILEGVTAGVDPSGFLVVRQDNGIETVILAGGVRPA